MVLNERHHATWIWIKVIEHQSVIHTVEASPLTSGLFSARRVHCGIEREVHHGLQVTVLAGQFAVFLPCGGVCRLLKPGLAHHVKIGVFFVDASHPACHRLGKRVWVCIHSDAIDAHRFYPPDAVLRQVVHHMNVVLIQVGHSRDKPSFHSLFLIHFAGIGIQYRC